jgi:hypothetical protein
MKRKNGKAKNKGITPYYLGVIPFKFDCNTNVLQIY